MFKWDEFCRTKLYYRVIEVSLAFCCFGLCMLVKVDFSRLYVGKAKKVSTGTYLKVPI